MITKSNFRLVGCTFMLSTIVFTGLTETPGLAATPPATEKQTNLWEKFIFWVNGGGRKKMVAVSRAGVRRTRIAGARGAGAQSDWVALIPENNGDYVGVGITDRPTFWFYVPPTTIKTKSIKFKLLDRSKAEVWSSELINNPKKIDHGLLPITYNGQALKDETYSWELNYQLVDGSSTYSSISSKILSGNFQKDAVVKPLFNNTLDRINFYGYNGIWHELITEIITEKQRNPGDVKMASAFRSLIFNSPSVKYSRLDDESKDDLELMERIVNARVISLL
jgi:Domain of Unknown Function (DUF928)